MVLGTWRDRWEDFIEPGWSGVPGYPEGWDTHLHQQIRRHGCASVYPARSRSEHVGLQTTLQSPGKAWALGLLHSNCFAADYPLQAYAEVPREGLGLFLS
jgi:hypothetical protein